MNVFNKLFVFRIEIYIYISKASDNLTPIIVNKEVNGAKNVFCIQFPFVGFHSGLLFQPHLAKNLFAARRSRRCLWANRRT